jgi:hypothetical protein
MEIFGADLFGADFFSLDTFSAQAWARTLALFGGVARGGLAQAPALAEASAGTRMTGRQVDVPPVGKFEIARDDAPGATLDDESRAVGKLAWKAVDLAHEILALEWWN